MKTMRLPTRTVVKAALKNRPKRPLGVRAMSGASVALFAITFAPLLAPPKPYELQEMRAFLSGESVAATFEASEERTLPEAPFTRSERPQRRLADTPREEPRVQQVSAEVEMPIAPEPRVDNTAAMLGAAEPPAEEAVIEADADEPAPIQVEAERLEEFPAPAEAIEQDADD